MSWIEIYFEVVIVLAAVYSFKFVKDYRKTTPQAWATCNTPFKQSVRTWTIYGIAWIVSTLIFPLVVADLIVEAIKKLKKRRGN